MDQNEENELLRITQNTDAFTCEVMGNAYFLIKDRPDILKPHPQMTAMINRRYSEIVDYPSFDIMSQPCWRADIIGSIRQHRGVFIF